MTKSDSLKLMQERIILARRIRRLAHFVHKYKGREKEAFIQVFKALAGVEPEDTLRIVRFSRGWSKRPAYGIGTTRKEAKRNAKV